MVLAILAVWIRVVRTKVETLAEAVTVVKATEVVIEEDRAVEVKDMAARDRKTMMAPLKVEM